MATNESYHVKGYDYPSNFSMNFCAPVVEELADVEGIPTSRIANVSAFYKDSRGDIYSIGQQNDLPFFRGKKLLLNYTQGSPCPDLDEDGVPQDPDLVERKTNNRRKSTLLSFVCDTAPNLSGRPAISFIGSLDHCTYVFEVRSRSACGGTTQSEEKGTLGPGAVFGVILGIALLVYLIGGIVYQRNVMHQRGWRQLPNYAVWAGLVSFVSVCSFPLFLTSLLVCSVPIFPCPARHSLPTLVCFLEPVVLANSSETSSYNFQRRLAAAHLLLQIRHALNLASQKRPPADFCPSRICSSSSSLLAPRECPIDLQNSLLAEEVIIVSVRIVPQNAVEIPTMRIV